MNDLNVRIVRELERGALTRDILGKRFPTIGLDEFNDAIGSLVGTGAIAQKGLRFHAVDGATIEHDQSAAAEIQHDQGDDMTTKQCKACHAIKPLEDFPKAAGMRDGRLNSCKPCTYAKYKSPARRVQASAKNGGGTSSVRKAKRTKVARPKRKARTAQRPPAVALAVPPIVHALNQVLEILNALAAEDAKTIIGILSRAIAA